MKLAIVIFAAVAAASAQLSGQFNPFAQSAYNANAYNPFNRFNQNRYNNRFPSTTYRPYVSSTPAPLAYVSSTPAPFPTVPAPLPAVAISKISNYDARSAETVRSGNDIYPDGSYNYYYETSNGIAAQEQGTPRNFGGNPPVSPDVAQGSFSWTSPEGIPIAISYVADENGYQPQGDAIPTPPPVPELIARALTWIANNQGQK